MNTAQWALVVAVGAAVISLGSLVYSARTYRRAGARVRVEVAKRVGEGLWDDGSAGSDAAWANVLVITVSNSGLAAVQVTRVFFRQGRPSYRYDVEGPNPSLPLKVDGLHSKQWIERTSSLVAQADIRPGRTATFRAVVALGDGRIAKSRPIRVRRARDSAEKDR